MSRPDPNYQGARTQAEADAIVNEFVLPTGWRLIAAPLRTFAFRSRWGLALWHDDVLEMSWAVYDLRGSCHLMQAHARRETAALAITTDLDGWVKSIDEVA